MNKPKYLETLDREVATTLRVMRAYPSDESELRPHAKLKTARELAWLMTLEARMLTAAMRDQLEMPPSAPPPPPPSAMEEVVSSFEAAWRELRDVIEGMSESDLEGTVRFFVAPKTIDDLVKGDFMWFMLHDHIHHRGQFSIYLRIAGGRVPSIYGPSADEPWS